MEQQFGTWDSVLLENLSEDSFINNIHQRYKRDHIYTYIGTSVIAINPYRHISEHSLELIHNYGSKGIFQLPPHIYGLSNLAFQSLKDQCEDQCILLTGESGSGKTESFKMIVNFLTHIQEKSKNSTHPIRKLSSASSTTNAAAADLDCVVNGCSISGGYKHRRTSSSCSMGPIANYMIRKNTLDTAATNTCLSLQRHQSPSPGPAARRCDIVLQHNLRTDSFERHRKCSKVREKMVDFDFLHHKSTENITTLDSSYTPPASVQYSKIQETLSPHPSKSCFKHNQTTQVPSGISSSLKSATSTSSSPYARSVSPKYLAGVCCPQCGHNKCTRARSFERNEPDLTVKNPSSNRSLSAYPAVPLQRGSCSNIVRQISAENFTRDEPSSLVGSTQRISLYDSHKLKQSATQNFSSFFLRKYMDPLKRLKECVLYSDVFLEAMGNASTHTNSNSSRYGKLFDIEIDFKGDPLGVHITHYTNYKYSNRRKKFSYILSITVGG